jgi:hypothetical protein
MGDSIFDNENYVDGKPDVAQRLHSMLGGDWKVSLLARDGATTQTFGYQIGFVPADATSLVVSVGGNDANRESSMLTDPELRTMRDSLDELWWMGELFALSYADAVTPLLGLGVPVTVCTIYDCDFPEGTREPVQAALAVFNDVILRFAFTHRLRIIDLRAVCTEQDDYVHVIEPSAVGGAKIAAAIAARNTAAHPDVSV